MQPAEITARCLSFLDGIGLTATARSLDDASLLPGIRIVDGALIDDPARLGCQRRWRRAERGQPREIRCRVD